VNNAVSKRLHKSKISSVTLAANKNKNLATFRSTLTKYVKS